MSNTVAKTDLDTITQVEPSYVWNVILFNCNCHTFELVVEQLMKAIGCSSQKASHLAQIADQFGSVKVYQGAMDKCIRVTDILGGVGLNVKIAQ